jgi:Ca2+-binding EF-hand superfamily protein
MFKILLAGVGLSLATAASVTAAQPAVRMPQTMTRNDVAVQVRDIFARLDVNRDNVLTQTEADAGARQIGRANAQGASGRRMGGMVSRMFGMADADNNGRVTLNEATGAALSHFDMVDRNRDGRITPDERRINRGNRRG